MEGCVMNNCLPFFSSCKKTPCYEAADVNKDGTVDIKDLEVGINKLMSALHFDPEVAKDTLNKFCSKVEKLIMFLEASKSLFASDPQTKEKIEMALTVLKTFTLLKAAVTDIGSQAKEVATNINNVGETITDVQRTSASIQAYLSLFEKAGLHLGLNPAQFNEVDAALARIKDMHALWSTLNQSTKSLSGSPVATLSPA